MAMRSSAGKPDFDLNARSIRTLYVKQSQFGCASAEEASEVPLEHLCDGLKCDLELACHLIIEFHDHLLEMNLSLI